MATPAYLQKRFDLLRIDSSTKHNLENLIPVFQEELDGIVRDFYNHITSFPEVRAVITSEAQIAGLRVKQRRHWIALFSCRFDDEYVESAIRIGRVHYQHRVPPYLYIAGYNFFHCELIDALSRRHANTYELSHLLSSVTRVINLDMDLALSVYTREYWREKNPENSPHWLVD